MSIFVYLLGKRGKLKDIIQNYVKTTDSSYHPQQDVPVRMTIVVRNPIRAGLEKVIAMKRPIAMVI